MKAPLVEDSATLREAILDALGDGVYVSSLRSKLGKGFIKTRRGFGYYIEKTI
ncbi:MAG: hypothetical protein AAGB46_02535 [Verrucomicrobiota bacterium]